MKKLGGAHLGEGGFGTVYDYDDVKPTKLYTYNGTVFVMNNNANKNIAKTLVYKEMNYIAHEEKCNTIVYNLFVTNPKDRTRLTHLADYSSAFYNHDFYIVYRLFQADVLRAFFTKENKIGRVYTKNTQLFSKTLLDTLITNALELLVILHASNYIHKDIKLENFLYDGKTIVLADYGMLSWVGKEPSEDAKMNDETSWDSVFEGQVDYMPPFCHYYGLKGGNSAIINYTTFLTNTIFAVNPIKYPSAYVDGNKTSFINAVAASYTLNVLNKFKIDLHALGIVILQLVDICDELQTANKSCYFEFAKKLMMDKGGFTSAQDAINYFCNNQASEQSEHGELEQHSICRSVLCALARK